MHQAKYWTLVSRWSKTSQHTFLITATHQCKLEQCWYPCPKLWPFSVTRRYKMKRKASCATVLRIAQWDWKTYIMGAYFILIFSAKIVTATTSRPCPIDSAAATTTCAGIAATTTATTTQWKPQWHATLWIQQSIGCPSCHTLDVRQWTYGQWVYSHQVENIYILKSQWGECWIISRYL